MPVDTIVVRATNWLGDSVLTIPAVRAVKNIRPSARLDIIAPAHLADLWHNERAVDGVIAVNRPTRFGEKARLVGKLRRARYGYGILFPNSFESALWFYLGGVKERIGFARHGRGALLTVRVPEPAGRRHQMYHYLSIVEHFGGSPVVAPPPRIEIPERLDVWAAATLKAEGLDDAAPLVGVCPGATYGDAKCWLPRRFSELAERLHREHAAQTIVFGGGGKECELAGEIRRHAAGCAVNMAGKTTVMQLAALMKRCALLVTNDTGPMHVASAVGTPVAAIFGPTDPHATGPLGESVIIQKAVECAPCFKRVCPVDHRCMAAVTVDDVFSAVVAFLKKSDGTRNKRKKGPESR
jgi:heptosyltransferase-2